MYMSIFRSVTLLFIRMYQVTLSPDHGPLRSLFPGGVCRYEPTCSEYGAEAVRRHGWRGALMSIHRISRCHPFSSGGYDPVSTDDTHSRGVLNHKSGVIS